MEELLTVAEIADVLKLNQQTIRNWIDAGTLPAVRIGPRRVRVKASDLEQMIDERYSGARAEADGTEANDTEAAGSESTAASALALGASELWSELAEASSGLSDAIAGGESAAIAVAFAALADSARALSEALSD